MVAKKVSLMHTTALAKKDQEVASMRFRHDKMAKENVNLRELNKQLLRDLERRDTASLRTFTEPNRDIF